VSVGKLTTVPSQTGQDDLEAFLALVERHSGVMYRLACRIAGNEQDAKDIVQESIFRAYRQLSGFEQRADIRTWLHRIVVNTALDFLRAAGSRPDRKRPERLDAALVIASPSPDPERLAASAETGRRIASALERLSPVERAAFTLRHFEGCSIDEIAQTIGLRANAAKQHIFRAIRKLRVVLEQERSGK
jgi:RNA polymerase sigma-70 factor (ECF subfamily)